MIGWDITIYASAPDALSAHSGEERRANRLAQWIAGAGGINWLEELVRDGKATSLTQQFSWGYPSLFTAKASDVLPLLSELIAELPPRHFEEWTQSKGDREVFQERCATCAPDTVLTIEAWDQS